MRQCAMQFGDGGMGRSATPRGSESKRAAVPRWVWAMAVVALAGVAPIIAVTLPNVSTASAASPPVARDDVARTDAATAVNVFTTGNDFDPDGDAVGVVTVATPAHGIAVNFGSGFGYTPNAGFAGVESIGYTIQDSTGATADAVATVWVDSGVTGPETPLPLPDYTYVYQSASVPITTT